MGMDREDGSDTVKVDTGDEFHEWKSKGGANAEDGSKRKRLRRYYCKICSLVRSRRELLKSHIISQHFEKVGANGEVDELIGTKHKKELMAETKLNIDAEEEINASKQVDLRRYCCKICGFVRGSRELLRLHINSHHVDKISDEYGIEGMIGEFDGSKAMDVRRYCCQLCGLVRSKRRYLRLHIITEHSEQIAADEEVDGFIIKKAREDKVGDLPPKGGAEEAIDEFRGLHIRSYKCKLCGVVRSKRNLLVLHIIRRHGLEALEQEKDFTKEEGSNDRLCPRVCDECGVSFMKPSHLRQHKLTHSALDVLRCLNRFSTRWETTLEELVYKCVKAWDPIRTPQC